MENSSFVGAWAGEWYSQNGEVGNWELTFDESGIFTGMTFDQTMGNQGPVNGRVEGPGKFSYEYRIGKVFFAGRGTLSLAPDGTLAIDYVDFQNGVRVSQGQSLLTKTAPVAGEEVLATSAS